MSALVGRHAQAMAEDTSEEKRHLRAWLQIAAPVREVIHRSYSHLDDTDALLNAAAEENVLFALENLKTYPAVRAGLEKGTLHLHAWFFKIATAELYAYDPEQTQFLPLVARKASPAVETPSS